jgi:hypothetical protein
MCPNRITIGAQIAPTTSTTTAAARPIRISCRSVAPGLITLR